MIPTTPLYHALLEHQKKNRSSFHTPGHKGNHAVLPPDLLALDLTELPDTDSLFEAEGAILQAEQETAQVLGIERTLFSAGGCTLCIQAMLRLATLGKGAGKRKILTGRVIHRSAAHTMALLDLEPVWLLPTPDAGEGLAGRVQPQTVAQALKQHPDAAAVYVTSPDYFGVITDIAGIAAVCAPYEVPLLVDNAHGAHLFFTSQPHPIMEGAAITACSAHKTLPVLTGGAWLNLADRRFVADAKEAMALFGSTSPSYPVMASLDLCTKWAAEQGKDAYARLEKTVAQIWKVAKQEGLRLPLGRMDPTRISLDTAAVGVPGTEAAEHFRRCGVEPEYADDAYVVLIATPFHTSADFERVCHAIRSLPKGTPLSLPKTSLPPLPPVSCSPREAILSPSQDIPLSHAIGRIAARAACPCPPGVPVVMPGEMITPAAAEFLRGYGFFTVNVLK